MDPNTDFDTIWNELFDECLEDNTEEEVIRLVRESQQQPNNTTRQNRKRTMIGGVRKNKKNNSNSNVKNHDYLETSKGDKAVWLMKCPPVVTRSLQLQSLDSSSRPVAKVILSIDPLHCNDDDSSTEFTMELAGTESGNVPKSYSMDMSKDFIPMSLFSESPEDMTAMEAAVSEKNIAMRKIDEAKLAECKVKEAESIPALYEILMKDVSAMDEAQRENHYFCCEIIKRKLGLM